MKSKIIDRIETTRTRAEVSGQSLFVTLATPTQAADPLSVAMAGDRATMAFWQQPDLGLAIGAWGVAHEVVVQSDESRFEAAAAQVRNLRARTTQLAIEGAERAPLLIGGFSFFAEAEWPGFPTGRLVLPDLALIVRENAMTWVAASPVDASTDPSELADELFARIELAEKTASNTHHAGQADHRRAVDVDLRDATYVKTVAAAVAEIEASDLLKVVLARQLIVEYAPDVGSFLAALRKRFTTCATFAFGSPSGVFCGATPERLVKVDSVSVFTGAVAGTAPRGEDATQDEVIADRLRHDPKEAEEHGYVITEIRRRLEAGGSVLDSLQPTEVMRLPGIQHLYTPISGTAPVGTDVLDLVGALHPTPAVNGLPADRALEWIAQHEPLDRGWYAGPVGYCDLAGNGEFRVALRSGLLEVDQSRLFVGAGIVGASAPERELEETSLKLGALLPSLLGS